jgi:hypothetical protein
MSLWEKGIRVSTDLAPARPIAFETHKAYERTAGALTGT